MLGDGFQYYVRHFWKCSDFDQILALGPPYLLQKYSKKKETCSNRLKHIMFANMRISKFEFADLCVSTFLKLWNICFSIWGFYVLSVIGIWHFELPEAYNSEIMKVWNCVNFVVVSFCKFWNVAVLNFGSFRFWKFELFKLWIFKLRNQKQWSFGKDGYRKRWINVFQKAWSDVLVIWDH